MDNIIKTDGRRACSRPHTFVIIAATLLTAVCCHVAAWAQATESDFTFNDGVRYSQWVVNSRMNNFYANKTEAGFNVYDESGTTVLKTEVDKKGTLDYVPGLVAKGIIEAAQYYSQYDWARRWALPWYKGVEDYANKYYNGVATGGGSLDDLNAVKIYLPLRELTAPGAVFANPTTYGHTATAIDRAVTGLNAHNTNYSIKDGTTAQSEGYDVAGGWWHKSQYNNQMWLDGQYMGAALLAQLINSRGAQGVIGTNDWDIVMKQLDIVWEMCWNPTDKLLYHAFDANAGDATKSNSHSETWAGLNGKDGITKYQSATYWGRACGWYFLALVDILQEMDKAGISDTDARYKRAKGYLDELAAGLKARQDAATGGWYQILDEDGTFYADTYNNGKKEHPKTYNYIESSATAIFAATYLKAIRLGYLGEQAYGETARNAYKCIVNRFFAADGADGMHIFGSCLSAGLGNSGNTAMAGNTKFRDGSKAYYLLGNDVPRVDKSENVTEGKVLGAFILAAAEYEQLYQKDRKILFAKDLAPTYTVSDGDVISIQAIGSETPQYQWYTADGKPVNGADEAEFEPTQSGRYYCVATTASGERIETSQTDVTVNNDKIEGETEVVTSSKEIVWTFTKKPDGLGTATKKVTFTSIDPSNTSITYISGSSDDIIQNKNDATIEGTTYTHYLKVNGSATVNGNRSFIFKAPADNGTIAIVYAGTVNGNTIIHDNTNSKDLASIAANTNTKVSTGELTTKKGNELIIYSPSKCYIYSIIWTSSENVNTTTTYSYKVKNNYKTPAVNDTRSIATNETGTLVKLTFGGWKRNNHRYTSADGTESLKDRWYASTKYDGTATDGCEAYFPGAHPALSEKKDAFENGDPFTLPVRGTYITAEPAQNGKLTIYAMHDGGFHITDMRGKEIQDDKNGTGGEIRTYTFDTKVGETYYIFSNTSAMSFCGASFVPDDTQATNNNLTLCETARYTAPNAPTQYGTITLERNMTANQWNTLTLPFDMTEDEVQGAFGEGTQIIILDNAKTEDNTVNLHFTYHEIQSILAGYPYLIKPSEDVTVFNVRNKWIDPGLSQTDIDCGDYTAKGTPGYSTADVSNASGTPGYSLLYKEGDIFISDTNGKIYISKGTSYGKGYRSYISNNGTAAAKSITMTTAGVEDNPDHGTTTEIRLTDITPGTAHAVGLAGVYSLSGQKLADTPDRLPAGAYIVNGRKLIIK